MVVAASRVAVPVKGASFIPSPYPLCSALPLSPWRTSVYRRRQLWLPGENVDGYSYLLLTPAPGEQAGQCFKGLLWSFPALLQPFSSYFIG